MTNNARRQADLGDLCEVILDLTRVTLAVSGDFASKNDAIRRLAELSIPPSRIATLLALPLPNVTSALSKARKKEMRKGGDGGQSDEPTGE